MELVANNNLLVYTNATTDPYTNNNGGAMLGQNQTNVDTVIGTANYDIGHVFSTGGGGVASLGVPCAPACKARGVTGPSAPDRRRASTSTTSPTRWATSSAATTRSTASPAAAAAATATPSTAYEPGSGSTIMAYAGICGADDLQPHSDAYFHAVSFDEIVAYTTRGHRQQLPGHHGDRQQPARAVSAGGGFTIPAEHAVRAHRLGDRRRRRRADLQLGGVRPRHGRPTRRCATSPPIFRSLTATASPTRTFPRLAEPADQHVGQSAKSCRRDRAR